MVYLILTSECLLPVYKNTITVFLHIDLVSALSSQLIEFSQVCLVAPSLYYGLETLSR